MSQDRDRSDLEKQVAELAANVDGLTNELVDAKERIRELEVEVGLRDERDAELDESKTVEELFEEAETDPKPDDTDARGDESGQANSEDDIIVG